MRALKSILGSPLVDEMTVVKGNRISFKQIIAMFLNDVVAKAKVDLDGDLEQVVCGRPVFFVDDDPQADRDAQNALTQVLRAIGLLVVGCDLPHHRFAVGLGNNPPACLAG